MNNKLTTEQKLKIALARTESLRAIAEQYGVHHSTIAEIYQQSEQILTALIILLLNYPIKKQLSSKTFHNPS
jgi:hypothetical protein